MPIWCIGRVRAAAEPRRTRALARSLLRSLAQSDCDWGGPRVPPCDGGETQGSLSDNRLSAALRLDGLAPDRSYAPRAEWPPGPPRHAAAPLSLSAAAKLGPFNLSPAASSASSTSLSLRRGRVRASARPRARAPIIFNDPYAGSPTKTLLRLLLPRSDQVRLTFRLATRRPKAPCAARSP